MPASLRCTVSTQDNGACQESAARTTTNVNRQMRTVKPEQRAVPWPVPIVASSGSFLVASSGADRRNVSVMFTGRGGGGALVVS